MGLIISASRGREGERNESIDPLWTGPNRVARDGARGLAACDREPESVSPDVGFEPTELTAGAAPTAQTSSEQPPATGSAAVPALKAPAPERETARSVPVPTMSEPSVQSRPAPPTDGPNADADQVDEHAGHDMGPMSDHDMDHM